MEDLIKELLAREGMTQKEFCDRVGVTKQHFKEIAACTWLNKLEKIAKALEMEPLKLLTLYYKKKTKKVS